MACWVWAFVGAALALVSVLAALVVGALLLGNVPPLDPNWEDER